MDEAGCDGTVQTDSVRHHLSLIHISKHITLAQSRMCAMLDVATSRLTSSFFSADVVVEVFFDNRWVDRCNFRPVV